MEEHGLKRLFTHLLIAGKNHADNPEENNIIPRYKYTCRVEIFKLLRLLWPAKSRERPQRGRKPGVKCILILSDMRTATFRANFRRILCLCHRDLATVITVVRRDAVSPPELSGNTPVLDIIRPVIVNLLHALRNQRYFLIFYRRNRRFNQFVHLHKPLRLDKRLNRCAASIVRADIVGVILDAD